MDGKDKSTLITVHVIMEWQQLFKELSRQTFWVALRELALTKSKPYSFPRQTLPKIRRSSITSRPKAFQPSYLLAKWKRIKYFSGYTQNAAWLQRPFLAEEQQNWLNDLSLAFLRKGLFNRRRRGEETLDLTPGELFKSLPLNSE